MPEEPEEPVLAETAAIDFTDNTENEVHLENPEGALLSESDANLSTFL